MLLCVKCTFEVILGRVITFHLLIFVYKTVAVQSCVIMSDTSRPEGNFNTKIGKNNEVGSGVIILRQGRRERREYALCASKSPIT